MVHLQFQHLIPPNQGEQSKPWIEFSNLAGLSPAEQWFYHWVRQQNLATPYPELAQVKTVLEKYLPQRTKRYTRNIPDPSSGESWLRSVLISGELLKLQPDGDRPPLTVAVYPVTSDWKAGLEKISSIEFSAARCALGIERHWMLVLGGIAEAAPDSAELMHALKIQALNSVESAAIYFNCWASDRTPELVLIKSKPMQVIIGAGGKVLLEATQQVWRGNQSLQTALFAGKEMMAITDDEGAFELLYLDFQSEKFPTIEAAKAAAPAFARAVLKQMSDSI